MNPTDFIQKHITEALGETTAGELKAGKEKAGKRSGSARPVLTSYRIPDCGTNFNRSRSMKNNTNKRRGVARVERCDE